MQQYPCPACIERHKGDASPLYRHPRELQSPSRGGSPTRREQARSGSRPLLSRVRRVSALLPRGRTSRKRSPSIPTERAAWDTDLSISSQEKCLNQSGDAISCKTRVNSAFLPGNSCTNPFPCSMVMTIDKNRSLFWLAYPREKSQKCRLSAPVRTRNDSKPARDCQIRNGEACHDTAPRFRITFAIPRSLGARHDAGEPGIHGVRCKCFEQVTRD